ncbi:MAG: ABC transporter ATP-binding protein [Tissierellia bacterium]|nr:ABC transporter ATP-binding protein [Tissierellia bacterium]
MDRFQEQTIEKTFDLKLMQKLWIYTKKYFWLLIVASLLLLLSTGADLYRPYLIKNVIDDYLTTDSVGLSESSSGFAVGDTNYTFDNSVEDVRLETSTLITPEGTRDLNASEINGLKDYKNAAVLRYGLILMAVVLAAFFATYFQQIVLNFVGEKVIYAIRSDLFRHLEKMDLRFYENNPVGRLVTRMTNDLDNINQLYTEVIVTFLSDVAIVVGSMVMMLILDWRLALVSFAVLPIMAIATVIFRKEIRKAYRLVRVKLAQINTSLNENFMGMKTIQIFNQESNFVERFDETNTEYREASLKELYVYAVFRPLLNLLYYGALILVLWYGGSRVLGNQIEVGVLVAYTLYLKQLFNPIMELAEKFNILQSAMTSIERIFLLFQEEEGVKNTKSLPVPTLKGDVEFKNVDFSYLPDEPILKNVSFTVKAGQSIAFVGATGSGKSTIINLLTRLYDVDSGHILIDGVDIRDYDKHQLRQKISPVLQDVYLFSGNIRNNIKLLTPDITDDEIMKAAEFVNADQIIKRFPKGLDHEVSEGGATFSQGERQLLSFARAIVHDPDILILDEATSNIDTETELLIQDAISKVVKSRTTFVVAHRLSTIQNADQIIVIHKGEIHERGTHEELLSNEGLYYDLYQLQYQESVA